MVGATAVRLNLPESLKIHNVFHISLVKLYRSDGPFQPLPYDWTLPWHEANLAQPLESVQDYRRRKAGHKYVEEYLVRWANSSSENDSWEPRAHFPPEMAEELAAAKARAIYVYIYIWVLGFYNIYRVL